VRGLCVKNGAICASIVRGKLHQQKKPRGVKAKRRKEKPGFRPAC